MPLIFSFFKKASDGNNRDIRFWVSLVACAVLLAFACTLTNRPTVVASSPFHEKTDGPSQPAQKPASEDDSLPAADCAETEADQRVAIAVPAPAKHKARPKESHPFQGIITQVAGEYEVDPCLVRAIIFAESGFNPNARSEKGAGGLMQLMPSTAEALGVRDIYDPSENIYGGVRYFRLLLDRFDGNVQLALAAYNAGSRHVRNYGGIPPFKTTRNYIKKVLMFQEKFKRQSET